MGNVFRECTTHTRLLKRIRRLLELQCLPEQTGAMMSMAPSASEEGRVIIKASLPQSLVLFRCKTAVLNVAKFLYFFNTWQ
jgi:hypothetical protein